MDMLLWYIATNFIIFWCLATICRFDFSGRDPPVFCRHSRTCTRVVDKHCGINSTDEHNGHDGVVAHCDDLNHNDTLLECDAVFMWWQLEMDPDGKNILSTAPWWAHSTPDNMQV